MRRLGSLLLGLAFASGATAAQAQTVISRQITTEPVETVVTQGPEGTVVTRRTLGAATPTYPPVGNVVETVETIERPAAATVTREVVRPRTIVTERTRVQSRQSVRDQRKDRKVSQRQVTRRTAAPMVLSSDERRVVYRTIVRERVVPAAPVVTQRIAPAPRAALYPPVTSISTGTARLVEAVDSNDYDSYVGMTLPGDVQFYDVPETVAVGIPATRPYRYAYMGDRVLLVDPATRLVVEDVTE